MPRSKGTDARVTVWIAVGGALLGVGCNFQITAPSYLHQTKLVCVIAEVESVGPLNPDRIGMTGASSVAEVMPGDELVFDAVVVDTDGRRLPADQLDSLWFQCGDADCYGSGLNPADPRYALDCDALDSPSLDEVCRLGAGEGRVSFTVGELGPDLTDSRVATFYGVIAWEGRSAESCWEARKTELAELENCAFVHRPLKVGPSWWMLAYAESIGLNSPIPVEQFPAPVYGQLANRVPLPIFIVSVDGQVAGSYPQRSTFSVARGATIRLDLGYDPLEQQLQSYYVARQLGESDSYWFTVAGEVVTDSIYTSKLIHLVGERTYLGAPLEFVVDAYADPVDSRILVVYRDDRFGEGLAEIDFEIED